METISIVKLIKNCKTKQFNGCAFENFHIHMIHKYIVYICKGKCLLNLNKMFKNY